MKSLIRSLKHLVSASLIVFLLTPLALAESGAVPVPLTGRLIVTGGAMVTVNGKIMVLDTVVKVHQQDGKLIGTGPSKVPMDSLVEYRLKTNDPSPVPVINWLRIEALGE